MIRKNRLYTVNKLLLFLLLPAACFAQSHKKEYNIYQEIGFSGKANTYGLHYTWQTQIAKNWYLGAGAEGMHSSINAGETMREGNIVPVSFRLSHASRLRGFRLVPFTGAGVVLTQPNGTVLEGGLGLAAGKWQLSASYRWYNTRKEHALISSGVFLRFSRLLIRVATKPRFMPVPAKTVDPGSSQAL